MDTEKAVVKENRLLTNTQPCSEHKTEQNNMANDACKRIGLTSITHKKVFIPCDSRIGDGN